jgi:serine/threonine protein kinase
VFTLQPGVILAPGYLLQEEIGRSPSAVVYRATHQPSERVVAIKVLLGGPFYEKARERFEREANAYRRVAHDGVVEILDVGSERDHPFIVMEYVEDTLATRLGRDGQLEPSEVITLGRRLATALDHVHAKGLVHGDIKPSNILLPDNEPSRAKLSDFGLVGELDADTHMTSPGEVIGTPIYMSPEQLLGQGRSPATDVWGLGMVLYECAYGRPPTTDKSFHEIIHLILEAPMSFAPLPGGLERVLARALLKDPAKRPTMAKLDKALAACSPRAKSVVPMAKAPQPSPGPSVAHDSSSEPWPDMALAPDEELASDEGPKPPASVPPSRTSPSVLELLAALMVPITVTLWLAELPLLVPALALALTSSLAVAAIMGRLLGGLEARSQRLVEDTRALRERADVSDILSRSMAFTLEGLLAKSELDPAIDLRRVSLALAIGDFQRAKDGEDRHASLDRAIAIADKLQEMLLLRSRPWYVRHKDALTVATAFFAAAAALVSTIAGALK